MKQVLTRMLQPTPPFFKKLRNIGLGLTAVAAVIVAGPVAMPAVLIKMAGYLVVAGGVMTAVSQAATNNDPQ